MVKYLFSAFYEEDIDKDTGELGNPVVIDVKPHESDCLTDVWIKACRIAGSSGKTIAEMHHIGFVTE